MNINFLKIKIQLKIFLRIPIKSLLNSSDKILSIEVNKQLINVTYEQLINKNIFKFGFIFFQNTELKAHPPVKHKLDSYY